LDILFDFFKNPLFMRTFDNMRKFGIPKIL
jgi:hypothetical protein